MPFAMRNSTSLGFGKYQLVVVFSIRYNHLFLYI